MMMATGTFLSCLSMRRDKDIEICYRDESGLIVAWDAGTDQEILDRHPEWHRSTAWEDVYDE